MNFVALSGLPRSGSTLLSAILSQNPEIHAEGNSAVCQLMWDMQVSCKTTASEQLLANRRQSTITSLMEAIPAIYYKDVTASHIVDKCRSWTLPANMEMMRAYITSTPKVLVLVRPLDEIVKSFVELRRASGWTGDLEVGLLDEGSDPIMRSLAGVEVAKATGSEEFLFIEYENLVNDTREVIDSIYDYCEWDRFQHNLTHVEDKNPEDDTVYETIYGLSGMHKVRPVIARRKATVKGSP